MAWTGWPVTSSTQVTKYEQFIQLWRACRERYFASNSSYSFWPRQNVIHSSGIVQSITSGTMTAENGHYNARNVGADGKWNLNEWYGYNDGVNLNIPQYYDLVIDANDFTTEHKYIKADILAHPSGNTITISNISKYPTMGWISSLSDLVGQPFYIIKDGGLWHKDRWPNFPNDQEVDKGTLTSATHISLTDSSKAWSTNQLQNKEVVTYGTNGLLYRLSITGNSSNTIAFASGDRVPTNTYSIVELNDRADPDRTSAAPFYWYGGAKQSYNTHFPDDSIGATSLPATNVDFSTGLGCGTVGHEAFDIDVWKDYGDGCANQSSDECFSPDLFKSIREIQAFLEEICVSFIEQKDYNGAMSIPYFTPATFFRKSGINFEESSYTPTNNGVVDYTFSSKYNGYNVYYAILNADKDDDTIGSGQTVLASGLFSTTVDVSYSGVLTTCVISPGWTRYYPKEFRYMYDNTAFIPSDGGSGPVMPDTSGIYMGSWITRNKSTAYKDHNDYGVVIDSSSGFINNDIARYSGDNWNDPTLDEASDYQIYYDNFFEGVYTPSNQASVDFYMTGFVESGSHRHITDYSKNWWTVYPQEGILRTETGIATGGSNTSLSDSTKSTNNYWDGTSGRWSGFILEVLTGNASGQKFPITNSTHTGLSFNAFASYSISNGDSYQIREPEWNINRWKDRTLLVTKLDGTTAEITITHNDDNSIFFDNAGFTVASGMAYEIVERRPGTVWKRSGSSWIKPTGSDTRGNDFKDDQHANLPYVVKKYGRFMKGDYVAQHLWNEVYSGINSLVWTKTTGGWTSRYVATSGENNFRNSEWPEGIPGSAADPDWTTAKSEAETLFLDPSASGEFDGLAPRAQSAGFRMDDYGDIYFASYYRNYAYLRVQNLNPILSKDVDCFNYGYIDSSDSPPSGSGPEYMAFDDNGDIVEYHKWRLFNSKSAGYSDTITSDKFGSISKPDDTPSPDIILTPPPYSSHSYTGYYVGDKCAIIKWNVSNGFTYYA